MKQATCEERITDRVKNWLEDMRRFNYKQGRAHKVGCHDAAEKMLERAQEQILWVEQMTVFKIDYSTGGPADWFEVFVKDGEIMRIVYHFSDWFDHAERTLTGSEFEAAEQYLRSVVYFEGVS